MTVHNTQKKETIQYLIIIGLICILIALIYGYKTIRDIRHRPFPIPREVTVNNLQGWMTIPYIARTYHIPEQELLKALNVSTNNARNLTLTKVAKLRGKTTQQVIEEVKIIIQDLQKNPPAPPMKP